MLIIPSRRRTTGNSQTIKPSASSWGTELSFLHVVLMWTAGKHLSKQKKQSSEFREFPKHWLFGGIESRPRYKFTPCSRWWRRIKFSEKGPCPWGKFGWLQAVLAQWWRSSHNSSNSHLSKDLAFACQYTFESSAMWCWWSLWAAQRRQLWLETFQIDWEEGSQEKFSGGLDVKTVIAIWTVGNDKVATHVRLRECSLTRNDLFLEFALRYGLPIESMHFRIRICFIRQVGLKCTFLPVWQTDKMKL